jgi:hypothetical protein
MMDRAELENLTTKELHDRAMSVARHHMDMRFLWRLVEELPAARVASGDVNAAQADIRSMTALLSDIMHSDEGELGDALRPLYIDYLEKHG